MDWSLTSSLLFIAFVCELELQFFHVALCFYKCIHKEYIMMFVPHLDPRHLLYTHKHKLIHCLTSLFSTSAVCERAVCVVTSPLWVVCSGWFALCSVFLLALFEVPSGKHNLCAFEIINKSVPKLCWLLLVLVDSVFQCWTSFIKPVGIHLQVLKLAFTAICCCLLVKLQGFIPMLSLMFWVLLWLPCS